MSVRKFGRSERRDIFLEMADYLSEWTADRPLPVIEHCGETISAKRACGLVWNLADQLPGGTAETVLAVPADFGMKGYSYASLAHALRNYFVWRGMW